MAFIAAAAAGLSGLAVGFYLRRQGIAKKLQEAEEMSARILRNAEQEAENKRREAQLESKGLILQERTEFEKETRERRAELSALERRLSQREEHVDKRAGQMDRRESDLNRLDRELVARDKVMREKEKELESSLREQRQQLERLSGITAEEAKKQLIHAMEQEARYDAAKMLKRIDEEAREKAERESKEIMVTSMQRLSRDYIAEATISVVNLPNEGMKGRIIGREGRNIRALESATGIDLIIDDTPDAVIISGFDPYRREIAKVALERLMSDGRIHPARIEEMVEKVKKDLDKLMREEAEKVIFDVGLQGIHPELVKVLGRLKYRTSYGQNNLAHAREAAFIAGIMASELGMDIKLIKRAALLHDIGKAVSHEEEGSHAALGADLVKRYGESPKIVNAVAAHHGEVEATCIESVLVSAAESLSAARPGARRESVESYVKRLEKLEQLATSFKGVEKAYAIQAGREIRIIVKQEEVSDAESAMISREIAKKVEQELTYPGQIKVTVIRENRYIEYAR
ncbi:MAG: ribonuclease Y [Nitrospirae bacterium]|nr:ribonuclease Y [Nitrospirota bacterium]